MNFLEVWRNLFPSNVIENVISKFLNNHSTSDSSQGPTHEDNCSMAKFSWPLGPEEGGGGVGVGGNSNIKWDGGASRTF